jgi:membrane associated rhomboid family serine protease
MLKNIKISISFISVLWIIQIINFILHYNLNRFGIYPNSYPNLIGILFSPFLHGSFFHLISNTIPLFILLMILLSFYKNESFGVILIVIILGGLLLWKFGRPAYHIGASLLIYGLAAFLFLAGILRRNITSIIISIIIAIFYGGLIYGLFPNEPWISFEGHIFGALSGFICGIIYRKDPKKISNTNKDDNR